jgi:hypothetical protein
MKPMAPATLPASDAKFQVETHACTSCDPGSLSPANLASIIDEVDASACQPNAPDIYFPGIQAIDSSNWLANWIASELLDVDGIDDPGIARMYEVAAERGAANRSSLFNHWTLGNYYNTLAEFAAKPSPSSNLYDQVTTFPGGGTVRHFARVGSQPTYEGDIDDVRALAMWALQTDPDAFLAMKPFFPDPATVSADELALLKNAFDTRVAMFQGPAFARFMVESFRQVLDGFHCGRPAFAHSGGGAVVGFTLRLIDAVAVHEGRVATIRSWLDETGPAPSALGTNVRPSHFMTVGLEAVLNEQIAGDFVAFPTYAPLGNTQALRVYNYLAGDGGLIGSETWRDLIVKEIDAMGGRALARPEKPIAFGSPFPLVPPDAVGHMLVGMNVLDMGRFTDSVTLPAYTDPYPW